MQSQHGFSLIEILVAMVVLSIGLLGLAGLMATGLRANHSAYLHSQASILAYDIIDAMRANRDAARANGYSISIGTASAGSGVAQTDLTAWKTNLKNALPAGDGAVNVTSTASGSYATVTVQWDDRPAGGSSTQSISLNTQI